MQVKRQKLKVKSGGQAVLVAVLFLVVLSGAVVGSFVPPALREVKSARESLLALHSYYAAESGSEDAVYRVLSGKTYPTLYDLATNEAMTTVSIAQTGNDLTVTTTGDAFSRQRSVETDLVLNTAEARFFYGVQVGDGGLQMGNNAVVNGNVYSNFNITGSNGATISDTAIVAGGLNVDPEVEWVAHDADRFFATAAGNRDIAQSFTAGLTATAPRVAVFLGKVGNPPSNITLRLTADNGGKPASTSLASALITPGGVGTTPSWINVSFTSPPTLTSGTKYWIVLDTGTYSASAYWNWRQDSTDAYTNHTAKITDNWSSGSAVWTDLAVDLAFRVWQGGVSTKIDGVVIGDATKGLGRANSFVNATIHGAACPNQYCVVENPNREEMPLSDGVIQDWRTAAAAGGTCAPPTCDSFGNFNLTNNAAASLGPVVISGDLNLSNNARLTITGTILVQGDINFSNDCVVNLDPGYGSNSGVLLTDDDVSVSNNCTFNGSGQPGSYVLLLSAKDAPANTVMSISNNAVGVIYYAAKGRIHFSNNAFAKEATAYGITMDNNAMITYESGLANIFFSSGPGASFDILRWREI